MKSEPSEYKKKIGSRIRSLVGEDRGAQAELCRAIDIGTNNLTHYFKGSLPNDPIILEKIADYYGVSLDWLITGREKGVEIAAEGFIPYGLSGEERDLLRLYRGSDLSGREDAKYILERHQAGTQKKAGG